MADEFYVTIEGAQQGKFKGESPRQAHRHEIVGLRFSYGVQAGKHAGRGTTGKRQHSPVVMTKTWGPATPQIFRALVSNEVLKSVRFEFVRLSAAGAEEVYHTIKLTNASVAAIAQYSGDGSRGEGGAPELEDVSFVFQKIDIENRDGQTTAGDDTTG